MSNFSDIVVYKQHSLSLLHQLPRSPSQAKKSKPSQEVPARPRSPSQAKKSQPGLEVLAKPRGPSQAEKSQLSQEVLAKPRQNEHNYCEVSFG